ncbi:hypothetical protein M885DRAFT_61359 [Pelagophyceae sp. CCMP2097]|nr:hypothetical protein M885DRAFT_61359 [Pelagophyceae sp. CCMP2097]
MERCAETISVRWDGCDGAALYQIQFRKFASHWPSTQQRVRTAACRKKNLDADCTYEIRVRGVSVAGDTSEYSTPLVSKTLPDLAKDALKADRAKDAADDVRAAALERAQREAADALQRAKARAADKAAAADTAQRAAAAEPSAEPPSPPADSDRAGAVPRLKLSWNCGVCERSNALGLSSCRVCSMPRSYCNEKLTSLKEVWQSCVTDDFRSARAAAADFASGAARKRPSRDEDAPSPRKKSAPPHAAREPHTSDAAAVSRPTARGTMARDAVAHPASARATSAQPASARAAGARPTSSRDAAAHPASARAAIPQLPAARHTSFYFDGADAPRDAASFDGRPASLVPSPQARKSDATRSPRTTGSPRLAVAKGKQTQSSPYLARLGTRGAKSVPRAAPAVDGTSSGGLSTGASTADSSGVANFDRPMRPLASAPRRKGNPKHVSKDPRPLKKAPSVTRGVKCVGHVGRWLRKKCSPDGNRQSSNESDESEDAPTLASLPLDRLASLSGAASNVSAWFEVLGPGEDRVYYHGATAAKADAAPNGAPQWYAMASSPEHASAVFAAGAAATPAFYWHAATGATQWDRPLDDAKQPLPYWAEVDVRDAAFADVKIYCWHAAEWRGLF